MKIFKYEFTPEIIVIDRKTNEPRVVKKQKKKMYFSMLHSSHKIFEEIYGEPVLSVLTGLKEDKKPTQKEVMKFMMNEKFIMCLAAASYLKINNGAVVNNSVTANEFIDIPGIKEISNDLNFVYGLIEMVFDNVPGDDGKSQKKNIQKKKYSKKKY